MAYDPEARRQSNAALIVGLVGLLIAGGAALAYFSTRSGTSEPGPTTVVQGRDRTVIVQSTPAPAVVITTPPQTNTIIVPVTAVPAATVVPDTNVKRNTTVIRNTRIITPPIASSTVAPRVQVPDSRNGNTTNVTVNNIVPTTVPATTGSSAASTGANTAIGTSDTNTDGNSATGNVAAGY